MTSTMNAKPAGRRGPTVVSNEAVYQAYVDLCGANPPVQATRQAVAETLCLPFAIIDEHTDRLLAKGRLRRILPGVFEPVGMVEIRAVTFTNLPDGGGVLEIGDQVINFKSMREGWAAYGQLEGWLRAKNRPCTPHHHRKDDHDREPTQAAGAGYRGV